jgi:predicted dehydrogenase
LAGSITPPPSAPTPALSAPTSTPAWDLASHEIAIFNFLLEAAPVTVSATGRSIGGSGREDVAFITLAYPGGLLTGIMVSWLNPRKVRTLSLVGEGTMATFDDLDPSPLAVHSLGGRPERVEPYYDSYGEFHLLTREIAVTRPAIPVVEPLKEQARIFVEALDKGDAGAASGERGWEVVRALEAVDASMRRGGAPVAIVPIRPEAG